MYSVFATAFSLALCVMAELHLKLAREWLADGKANKLSIFDKPYWVHARENEASAIRNYVLAIGGFVLAAFYYSL